MDPAALLARAFHHDPFLAWAEPDPRRRPRTLRLVFGALLEAAGRAGCCLVEPGFGSVDWKQPGHLDLTAGEVLRFGLWRLPLVTPPAVLWRLAGHEAAAMRRVAPHLGPGGCYLGTLGVEPSREGQGHGGRLLHRALEQMAAQAATACVLRTEQPRNVHFYRRHGFEVVDESVIGLSGLTVWVFKRALSPPQAA